MAALRLACWTMASALGLAACGGVDRGRLTEADRPPPGPTVPDLGSGPFRCDQEAGYEPVPVYDPSYEPLITDYAAWPVPPAGCDDPDDDEPCICDEEAPPAECLGVVRRPEYIEDFELGASDGTWYTNNETCELCQKYTDIRVGPYPTAGSTERTLARIEAIRRLPVDQEPDPAHYDAVAVELERLRDYLDYLIVRYRDRGLYADFVAWREQVGSALTADLTQPERLAQLRQDLLDVELRLQEGLTACRDECVATQWPTPVFTKPLPASLIPGGGRCGSRYALNVKSGPLISWGGTIGLRFAPVLDGSEWEGIAFWARVGTGSRTPVRIELGERHTDEKFDEGNGPLCNPLHTDDDTETGCDKFGTALQLGPDWKFYAIPFDELRQKGWGKRAPYFDRWGLRSLSFQFERGVWDLWIDDVRLYRRAEP